MGKKRKKDLWVSADGSWGFCEVKRFNPDKWTDADWETLDNLSDNDKLKFAKSVDGRPVPFGRGFVGEVRTFIIGPNGVEEL